jgi:ribosome-associated protein
LKKQQHTFELSEEYIELIKLLKLMGLADTGGDAKNMVDDGLVQLNGVIESRKRAKIRVGDFIETEVGSIKVI